MAVKKPAGSAVAVKRESLPSNVMELLEKQKQAVMDKIGKPSTTVIGIKQNKTFSLPNGEITEGPIDLVILDFVSVNQLYDGVYDPSAVSPPVCFAIGDQPDNLIASDRSIDKQSDTCASCPQNRYESAARGKGKACKNTRLVAVMSPDATEDDPIWLLKVSPTGLKSFDGYIRTLSQRSNLAPIQVVTKVGFDPASDYPSLRFAPEAKLDNLEFFLGRMEEAADLIRQEPDYSGYEVEEKKPARGKSAPRGRR